MYLRINVQVHLHRLTEIKKLFAALYGYLFSVKINMTLFLKIPNTDTKSVLIDEPIRFPQIPTLQFLLT